jgi:peptidoglycan/LPS O-acetylase OafA/YrhL
MNPNDQSRRADHIIGIDSLRAIAALIVVLDHLGLAPQTLFGDHKADVFALMRMASNCLFNGPAAVIVFFVISGFCIHFPQTRTDYELNVRRFYTRRALRIGLPALAAIILYRGSGYLKNADINDTILWSVICECVYYALYPALCFLGRKLGWAAVFAAAYITATSLCATHLGALRAGENGYWALGWLAWIVGLPCWLLGCWLADSRKKFSAVSLPRLWAMRAGIFIIAFGLRIAKFHIHNILFSDCFTLNLFALPVAAWIGVEMASSVQYGTSRFLEWAGKWSYSLYLIHPVSGGLLALLGVSVALSSERYHLITIAFALVLSYCFYLAIERPAHQLALVLSRRGQLAVPTAI